MHASRLFSFPNTQFIIVNYFYFHDFGEELLRLMNYQVRRHKLIRNRNSGRKPRGGYNIEQ